MRDIAAQRGRVLLRSGIERREPLLEPRVSCTWNRKQKPVKKTLIKSMVGVKGFEPASPNVPKISCVMLRSNNSFS
jgi:hypothetical protein